MPPSSQSLVLSTFKIKKKKKAIMLAKMWNHWNYFILACISLLAYDVEHLFMSIFAIFISSSVKCLYFGSSSNILDTSPLFYYIVCKLFLPFCNLFIHPFNKVFCRNKVFKVFIKSNLLLFLFMDCDFHIEPKNSSPILRL